MSCKGFDADLDIAGDGVLLSFILLGWTTVIVAVIAAIDVLLGRDKIKPNMLRLIETAKSMRNQLCDLQVVTGTAIVIAGFTQLHKLSLYHQRFVFEYWWLTLNSFWAARAQYINLGMHTGFPGWHVVIRQTAILICISISVAFQAIVLIREENQWDEEKSGYCYLSHDTSSTGSDWLWVAGAALYALSLALRLLPPTRAFIDKCDKLRVPWKPPKWNGDKSLFVLSKWLLACMVHLVTWVAFQFVAIWFIGAGYYPLEVLAYIGFATWSTFFLVDLKVANKGLVTGSESEWGFGQVLPLALFITVGFNAVDSYRGERTKCDCMDRENFNQTCEEEVSTKS
ncbi:hypothetical protein FQN53_000537 [Emmonsiellopsis sp. PD_33]|nr:hypothetical protein FQN53_000537 [Emmonsiellopsis sp. PD_33]